MQVYKAPIKDYRFLIKDFLNSEYLDIIFKNSSNLELIRKKIIMMIWKWKWKWKWKW